MLDNAQITCNPPQSPDAAATIRSRAPCGSVSWHCIYTGAGRDQITADIEIRTAGLQVFNPSIWKPAYSARLGRPGRPDRIVPMFPRYLFAAWQPDDPWQRVRYMRGVITIIAETPAKPSVVPDQIIASIRSQLAANDCLYPPEPRAVAIGATARITTGSLADMTGICTWTDTRRVALLLSIMGRSVTVRVPRESVEAA
jgi:transcription antitermination factor NusG